jgi:hypothetical protein
MACGHGWREIGAIPPSAKESKEQMSARPGLVWRAWSSDGVATATNPRCAARVPFQKKVAQPGDRCTRTRPNITPSYAKGVPPASQSAALMGESRGVCGEIDILQLGQTKPKMPNQRRSKVGISPRRRSSASQAFSARACHLIERHILQLAHRPQTLWTDRAKCLTPFNMGTPFKMARPADENLPEVVEVQYRPAANPDNFPEVVPDTSPEFAQQRYYTETDKYPAYYDTAPKLPYEQPVPGMPSPEHYHQPWTGSEHPGSAMISPNSSLLYRGNRSVRVPTTSKPLSGARRRRRSASAASANASSSSLR